LFSGNYGYLKCRLLPTTKEIQLVECVLGLGEATLSEVSIGLGSLKNHQRHTGESFGASGWLILWESHIPGLVPLTCDFFLKFEELINCFLN
jgi:hypothetical protein